MHAHLGYSRTALQSFKLRTAAFKFLKPHPSQSIGISRHHAAAYQPATATMDPGVESVVRKLHANDSKCVVFVTGGACQALGWFLAIPGASNTVLEMSVPYARNSLIDMLGQEPAQYCSEVTAVSMAKAAYRRAANLASTGSPILGVSATCALATEPPKRGEHRVHIAVHTGLQTRTVTATLAKGRRTRLVEDTVASLLLLHAVSSMCGVDCSSLDLQLMTPGGPCNGSGPYDVVTEQTTESDEPLQALLEGRVNCVEFSGGQVWVDAPRRNRIVLPGSFNPLHTGHTALLAAACSLTGPESEGCFELSVGNADKGRLPLEEVRKRLAQFMEEGLPVVVTSAPLFVEKIHSFPQSRFVVGWDTAVRLVDPKYHDGSIEKLLEEFQQFRVAGCSFVVAGRKDYKTGLYRTAADVPIPRELKDLFTVLPEFRMDVSSTELRAIAAPLPASQPPSQPPSRPPTP